MPTRFKHVYQSNRLIASLPLAVIATLSANFAESVTPEKYEEVVVIGEKIERSLQETVSSVAVLTADEIEETAIYDIQDVFDRVANVNGAQGNEGFTIRGINDNEVSAGGSSGLASYYFDGAFIDRRGIQAGQKELWDIAQIEIFRGPQSTNQGRNTLAGSILVRSEDPTYEPEGKYRVSYGTDNTHAVSFAYSNAIIADELAFRIAIDDQATDGYVNNVLLEDDEYGASSNTTVRGKLLYEPSAIEGLSILTTLSFSENESGDIFSSNIDGEGNSIDPFSNQVFANIKGIENVDQSIATTDVNYEINENWSLTSITSFNETEFFRQDDDDRQSSGGDAVRRRSEKIETFSQEFRFTFESERFKGVVGAYYFDQDTDEELDDLLGVELRGTVVALTQPGLEGLIGESAELAAITISELYDDPFIIGRQGIRDQTIENYALFGNFEYDVNDFVTLFAGARYDNEKVFNQQIEVRPLLSELPDVGDLILPGDLASFSGAVANATIPPVNEAILNLADFENLDGTTADYSAFLPKAGVTLNWTDDLNTSFTAQRAYRAGGSGTNSFNVFEFDPEFTNTYEFSLRSSWFDNRLVANANIFYTDWQDQQIEITEPDDPTGNEILTVNAGESELKGGELELNLFVNDVLDLNAAFGYVETEFTEFDENSIIDLSGNEFNNAPKVTASFGFGYEPLPSVRVQADVTYQDESYDNSENTTQNDARTIVNSKITYQYNRAIEIALVARNVFDREYLLRDDTFGNNTVIVGQPRTVLLQLQGKF